MCKACRSLEITVGGKEVLWGLNGRYHLGGLFKKRNAKS